jgi:CPA1 family monovalent cation:H+ antiporter
MSSGTSFVLLFSIATAVAIAVRSLRVPYTVALVVVGLVLGTMDVIAVPHLTKELLFTAILPGLLFEAAFNLDARELWGNRLAIGTLAVPGVILAIALTAAMVVPLMSALGLDPTFEWRYGLVFGALVAATDPIAVVALFHRLDVGRRLTTLVEGESLLNDGTSVVLFTLILAFATGTASTPGALVAEFATIVGSGALMGALVGVATTQITKRIDEPVIEITLTVIAAYGSFALAEYFHGSGVIATVVTGMFCGTVGWRHGMSPSTKIAVETFWDYVAFALNSIVFLLIGFEVRLPALIAYAAVIGIAYLASLVARFGVVLGVATLLRPTRERIPRSWIPVLTWGGLRGALSMVLALALPADFPHRTQLIAMTYGVVLLSLLLQGLSMAGLLRRLGLIGEDVTNEVLEHARGDLRAVDTGLAELTRMRRDHAAPPDVLDAIEQRIQSRRADALQRLANLHLTQTDLRRDEAVRAVRRLLLVERADLIDAKADGSVREEVLDRLTADVDSRLARLEERSFSVPEELLVPENEASSLNVEPRSDRKDR